MSNIGPWHIDEDNSDTEYLYVDVDGLSVILKRSSEGLIVDVYPLKVADSPLATLCVCFNDFREEEDDEA